MVDVNKPLENPMFVAAVEAFQKTPNTETEAAFFAQIKQAHFLLVLHEKLSHDAPDADGKFTLKEKSTISFPMLSPPNSAPIFFGFTDWSALYAWRNEPNQQTMILSFDDVAAMVLRENFDCAGFLVNAASHDFFLPRTIIAHVSGRANPYTVQKETTVALGEPREYPHALVEAVKAELKQRREVKRAWLRLMVKDSEQSFLIVLEHTGDKGAISQMVGKAASPHLGKGMFVDIVTTDQEFGANAVKDIIPFYKRGLFG